MWILGLKGLRDLILIFRRGSPSLLYGSPSWGERGVVKICGWRDKTTVFTGNLFHGSADKRTKI